MLMVIGFILTVVGLLIALTQRTGRGIILSDTQSYIVGGCFILLGLIMMHVAHKTKSPK